ncbi:MAG: hypothetical protein M3P18_23915, partial [Actinomycetota bacterium]|nr:hypothetical protein [Actinomycetota bacterium]
LEKAAFLRERGGMALLLTHPDYMLDDWRLAVYEELLDAQAGAATTWHALPREVSSWWRRRAASTIERVDGVWRVVGPAAEDARIEWGPLA